MRFTLVLSLVLSLLMVIFALMNGDAMDVNFGFAQTSGPIALVLIITFIIGVGVGAMFMVPGRMRKSKEVKTLKRRLDPAPAPLDAAAPETTAPANTPLDAAAMPFPPPPDPMKQPKG